VALAAGSAGLDRELILSLRAPRVLAAAGVGALLALATGMRWRLPERADREAVMLVLALLVVLGTAATWAIMALLPPEWFSAESGMALAVAITCALGACKKEAATGAAAPAAGQAARNRVGHEAQLGNRAVYRLTLLGADDGGAVEDARDRAGRYAAGLGHHAERDLAGLAVGGGAGSFAHAVLWGSFVVSMPQI